jgi:thymidylate synthase
MNGTDKAYQELLEKILTKGKEKRDRTGTGTISIFSHTLEMDMSEGFPLLTTKKMFTRGIIHELLWFLNGDTNIKYLVDNGVNIWNADAFREYYNKSHEFKGDWPDDIDSFKERIKTDDKFAEKWGQLGPVYGQQWVNWDIGKKEPVTWEYGAPTKHKIVGINQIQNAIDTLNNNPDSRRIIVSAWNVGELDKMALPPCHWAFELYTEELTDDEISNEIEKLGTGRNKETMSVIPKRKLHLKWHQRSVDTFLGLPFNIASYGFLLHMFAQQTNMVPGTLIGDLTNVHIYKNHIEQCKEQLSREPMRLPKLALCKPKDIFSYEFEDFLIKDYESHPSIKGKISV